MPYDTLEKAQARILELEEENQNLKTEKDTLSEDKKKLETEKEDLRTLNQKYFNKLIAQEGKKDEPEDEPEVQTCESFAEELYKKGEI